MKETIGNDKERTRKREGNDRERRGKPKVTLKETTWKREGNERETGMKLEERRKT